MNKLPENINFMNTEIYKVLLYGSSRPDEYICIFKVEDDLGNIRFYEPFSKLEFALIKNGTTEITIINDVDFYDYRYHLDANVDLKYFYEYLIDEARKTKVLEYISDQKKKQIKTREESNQLREEVLKKFMEKLKYSELISEKMLTLNGENKK